MFKEATPLRLPVLLVLCVLAGAAPAARAQQNGRRVYEEQLRVRIDEQIPSTREVDLDAGGWFSFAFFDYSDRSTYQDRTLRQYQIRAWAKLNLFRVHQFYVRGLVGWEDWNRGDHPRDKGDEDTGPEVERAWYKFDLGQLLRNQTGQEPPVSLKVKVGRQFARIGTALVLSMPLDMIQLEAAAGQWELMALLAKTRSRTPNIDSSERVFDRQQRCFWGAEVTYRGLGHHRPFIYYLGQRDHTAAKPEDASQKYEYDSQYLGIGSTGSLILRDLRYRFEVVGEWGSNYSAGVTSGKDRICAMAVDVLLEYLFRVPTRPRVSIEYLYGSGDADRSTSATSTIGGNRSGTRDHSFIAFGFRDTGLCFSPRMANLHIYSVGASLHPLEHIKLCRKLEVGVKAFFYQKDTHGPLSDTTADKPRDWVGWEAGLFANWRLTSDLTWTIRYGAFQPGEAFTDRTCRYFLLTAVTFSF